MSLLSFVEMKVAPFRALTQRHVRRNITTRLSGRNEGRPYQGIDTSLSFNEAWCSFLVEMKVAPFRALTQHMKSEIRVYIHVG